MKKFWVHINFIVILVAAILLELAMGVMYYSAQTVIKDMAEQYFERETKVASLRVSDYMRQVEVAVDNMTWVVQRNLHEPDSMYALAGKLLNYNPVIYSAGIAFVPNYYPQKGYWYEPYVYNDDDGKMAYTQLGNAEYDYTKMDFYKITMLDDRVHWCEPYIENDGSNTRVSTYSAPVHDKNGRIVAVIEADMEIEGLKRLIDSKKKYASTRSFLFSKGDSLVLGDDSTLFTTVDEIEERDTEDEGFVIMEDDKGENVYVFHQPVAGPAEWKMISVFYEKDLFKDIRQVRILLTITVVMGLLLLLFIIQRARRHLKRLRAVNTVKDRIEGELGVAKRIQESMLPDNYYKQDDVEISGELIPVREVGGDLYDYYIRNDKLFFCVGDVSGKGVAAAMLMTAVHSMLRASSAHDSNPAYIMRHINEALCQNNNANMFVTMFIGVLDLPTGHLKYCNAGHDAPMMMTSGGMEPLPVIANLPVGVFDDVNYAEQETVMEPESVMFLYTDGLTEAKNKERKMYGIERAQHALIECRDQALGLSDTLRRMEDMVHQFADGAEQSDDLTMLAIRFTPKSFESMLTERLILNNDVKEVGRLSEFVKNIIARLNIDGPLGKELRLAVEEAVVNVIDYAYPMGSEGKINVEAASDGSTIRFRITDTGTPFDPTTADDADTSLPAEERKIGGLGILLVKGLMDSVNYERDNGMNILTLTKKYKDNERKN